MTDDPCKPLEDAVLLALPGSEDHPVFGKDFYSNLSAIADTANIDKEAARFACRRLRDKGLAVFCRGLWTDDGMPAGSGYKITEKGIEALKERGLV
jgi:hypothetical protein